MMKRTICIRVLTVLLAVCMLWQTVGAVPFSGDWAGTMWSRLLGRWSGDGLETNSTDTAATNADNETKLVYFPVTLYNYDTDKINAVTHQMEVDAALAAGGIRHLTQWNGMYFNNGTPAAERFVYETGGTESAWVPVSLDEITNTGEYVIVNYRTMKAGYILEDEIRATGNPVASSKGAHVDTGNTAIGRATKWTIEKQDDGTYRIYTGERYIGFYRNQGQWDVRVSESHDDLVIEDAGHGDNSVSIGISIGNGDGYWLNSHDYLGVFSAWNESGENDDGSRFYIYQLKENVSSTDTTDSLPYAEWNHWKKDIDGDNRTGQYTYSGLVQSRLNARKELILTKTDPGLFTTTAVSGKTVYTNVEMPFTFDPVTGKYTFDASANGVYFKKDATQGSTTAQSNGRLYFDAGDPQSNKGSYGDGSTTVWMPFNSTQTIDGEANCDYHFGMQAVLPFTMTANGRVNPTDDSSEKITFDFSGDDDVWVFIDGILVGDLGGIHNRLNLTLDFAANSWRIWEDNDAGENDDPPGFPVDDYNDAPLNGRLFNDSEGAGILGQTRESFAATSEHTLTVFYLERGAGSSNCKIQFNLPMNDTLSVTKRATQSWTDKDNDNMMDEGELSPLTPEEQATVDKISNYYILTKYNDVADAYEPVANVNYNLLDVNGQILSTPATSKDGIFRLSNGQTARFNIELTDKDYYRVEEIIPDNVSVDASGDKTYLFSYTNWSYSGTAAGGYTYGNTGPKDERDGTDFVYANTVTQAAMIPDKGIRNPYETINLSNVIAVHGDPGSNDSLEIVCENFLNTTLPNPSARPMNDQIVIDYGLSVEIDVLANDIWRGDSMTLSNEVTGARSGTVQIVDNKLVYTLTEQLTVPEVLTYTITVRGDGKTVTGQAKVYIFPATSMYYEEDFSDFVKFGSGEWEPVGTAQTDHQEPGVVGTVDDSPYGSDVAYKNDSGDSNGSSMFVDVSESAASFSYTFTGTGTSFFGRMGTDTGYMKVVIKQGDTVVATYMRNTIYKPTDNTGSVLDGGYLYNIPVFTWDAEDAEDAEHNELGYGTYTVEVSIANASKALDGNGDPIFGGKFFLDGIRVMNPLNTSFEDTEDNRISLARIAYANDGEQNMVFATVRDKLISEAQVDESGNAVWEEGDNFILFTDNNGKMVEAQDYVSFGPKEEVYLYDGQSVSFALDNWNADANDVFLGIKVPNGSGTVVINGHSLDLSNAADCYFEISGYADVTTNADSTQTATFVITAAGGDLISLTNIKVTGTAEFAIVNNEEIVG